MEYKKIKGIDVPISLITLGTWAFGGDAWWGPQEDLNSMRVMELALEKGVSVIDTAPIYGRGRSEKIVGDFLRTRKARSKVSLATKVGLSWQGASVFRNLKKERILEELDLSRNRLQTDYFDLYQVHWPDPDTPIAETAQVMYKLKQKGLIKAVGVSNYSVSQMVDFMKECPLDSLQPEYSMFKRDIEAEIVPFCLKNNIKIISYAPLYSGLLTGKFFLQNTPMPSDTNRQLKSKHFKEPYFSINKKTLEKLSLIASGYKKTLTQLVINWNFSQAGITSSIVGSRKPRQIEENVGSVGWSLSSCDLDKIETILSQREERIQEIQEQNGS